MVVCRVPLTNTWSVGANLDQGRSQAAAAVVNGKLLVFGGILSQPIDTVEEYDPVELYAFEKN